ncbi:hypothetical protein DVR12_00830 [Chitinophaga silvatica]|uniref:LVIVD repeat-containing protein n=1 Tax=Chitinophaga silvatica TaxID=2282649 RepID=A0A3E1YG29_9BACT|nr:hypothetical protein [Chitinophaga silvatica]RFS26365.1 hypothetical protein DVR12_00830 [Chitinophaga silvatica]
MKSILHYSKIALAIVFLSLIQSGCLKEDCEKTVPYKLYIPVYTSLEVIRASVNTDYPKEITDNGKIYLYGKYIFLNEIGKGIHVIDNTDPSAPKNLSFINIPGNTDLAIKDNILYADSYIDLVALDIHDPLHAKEVNRIQAAFPYASYNYGMVSSDQGVITSFKTKDTIIHYSCKQQDRGTVFFDAPGNFLAVSSSSSVQSSQVVGQAGSMATFGLLNGHLYTMNTYRITSFDLKQAANPQKRKVSNLRIAGETLFPYKNYLFIGGTTGMDIFDVSNPDTAVFKTTYQHLRSCDPVIVENDLAYVTLRGGAACNMNATNVLEVIDVKDPVNPQLLKSYEMKSPYGLGLANNKLVICENLNGLRLLDAKDPLDIKTVNTLTNIKTTDVIHTGNDNILLVGENALYQFQISDMQNPKLLSKISFMPKSL